MMLSGIRRLFRSAGSVEFAASEAVARVRALIESGRLAEAESACQSALSRSPDDLALLSISAEIATVRNDPGAALSLYSRIIDLDPQSAQACYKRANVHKNRGELERALADYDRAVAIDPAYGYALCNRGVVLAALGRREEALASYENAIAVDPDDSLVHFNRGNVLRELGRKSEADEAYARALQLHPENLQALVNRAQLLRELQRFDAASEACERAIALAPDSADAWLARAALLQDQGKPSEALRDCDRALALRPDLPEAHLTRGGLLFDLKQWAVALRSVDRAISLKPAFPEAQVRRGEILAAVLRYEEALACYDAAIVSRPSYAEAHERRAETLVALRRFGDALVSYDAALDGKPDLPFTRGMRTYARMYVCDWREFAQDVSGLRAGIEAGEAVCPPLVLLSLSDDEALHLKAAKLWAKHLVPKQGDLVREPIRAAAPAGKMRVGYFSGDLHEHPVSALMIEVFERHDRAQFEIVAFSYGPPSQDPKRKRLEAAFDRFIDVKSTSDRDVALLAREYGLDIAVDLGGFTGSSRTAIFAHRAAPVQVNYLGYPGTMAVDYMDYLIADATVIPIDRQPYYRESVVYLPNSYLPNDSSRTISTTTKGRSGYGLPQAGFVFCCFNNSYKITPDVFAIWMRLLHAVPGSILWLSRADPITSANLSREAAGHGIAAERLVFAERVPSAAEHLARYRVADLFLDTLPYNAHATTIDAVWAGCPILTRMGNSFAGRVAASVLLSLGMAELVTRSAEEYEQTALQLATDPQRLAAIRAALAVKVANSALFDTRLFTRHLEMAFEVMVRRSRSGLAPAHFSVGA